METFFFKSTLLVLAASLGYSAATIGMKLASQSWGPLPVILLLCGFAAATFAEIILMRGIHLGVLYLIIIAVETLIVLSYSISIGEGLDPRQMVGAAFVMVGLAVVSL